ncbi:MAG: ethanolamine ammonia-lyase subunit EutC [Xanthobacteraceae bacterium]
METEDEFWTGLRQMTAARIGLKRAGASLATGPLLDFKLAHARARDAVAEPLDEARLAAELAGLDCPVISVASAAADRQTYLLRPDLGRRFAANADAALAAHKGDYDVVFVVADGLSSRAVALHAGPVSSLTMPALRAEGWRIGPVVIVRYGRVAIGDAIATALGAESVAVLIGERPGLTAPHSMGAYLTFKPRADTSDAERNCISNIRPDGVDYTAAGSKLAHLLRAMRTRRLSGVQLKDDSDRLLALDH